MRRVSRTRTTAWTRQPPSVGPPPQYRIQGPAHLRGNARYLDQDAPAPCLRHAQRDWFDREQFAPSQGHCDNRPAHRHRRSVPSSVIAYPHIRLIKQNFDPPGHPTRLRGEAWHKNVGWGKIVVGHRFVPSVSYCGLTSIFRTDTVAPCLRFLTTPYAIRIRSDLWSLQLKRRRTATVPIWMPDWLTVAPLARDLRDVIGTFAHGRLLDVGCGERPFKVFAQPGVTWVGMDLPSNVAADVHGNATDIPVGDGTFQSLLCTQVLEHVTDPGRAIAEFARVIEPGGILILSVPLHWELHEEPNDFYRYTEYGLKTLLSNRGFVILKILRQGSSAEVAGQVINLAVLHLGENLPFGKSFLFRAVKAPFYLFVNVLSYAAGRLIRSRRDTLNYVVVARRLIQ